MPTQKKFFFEDTINFFYSSFFLKTPFFSFFFEDTIFFFFFFEDTIFFFEDTIFFFFEDTIEKFRLLISKIYTQLTRNITDHLA